MINEKGEITENFSKKCKRQKTAEKILRYRKSGKITSMATDEYQSLKMIIKVVFFLLCTG